MRRGKTSDPRGSLKKRKRAADDSDFDSDNAEDVISSSDDSEIEPTDIEDVARTLPLEVPTLVDDAGEKETVVLHQRKYHDFSDSEVNQIRSKLLAWYDNTQREMPWRRPSPAYFARLESENRKPDPLKVYCEASTYDRAYAVLVSELMLQQTQVATVRDYFRKWMIAFPSVQALASASLEEVNQVWAGLGYYRRAKLLHQCAKEIVSNYNGLVPQTVKQLLDLPGIGPYTAGAVSSIAFDQPVGIVDGNVIRVISRLKAIEADPKLSPIQKYLWSVCDRLVDPSRPGDFNQALMEFGAVLCTPKSPKCESCPLIDHCTARAQVRGEYPITSDGDTCSLCTSSTPTVNVTKYPIKTQKKPPKTQTTYTTALRRIGSGGTEYLVVQRPNTGLLAGLWEFPSIDVTTSSETKIDTLVNRNLIFNQYFQQELGWKTQVSGERNNVGEISHLFSHIKQTIIVDEMTVGVADIAAEPTGRAWKWIAESDLESAAISKSVHKIVALISKKAQAPPASKRAKTAKKATSQPIKKLESTSKQPTILSMFKK